MRVLRKTQLETNYFQIGDQICFHFDGKNYDRDTLFLATVQKITDNGVLFMFDESVNRLPMNDTDSNKGGFDKTLLAQWLNSDFINSFPTEIKSQVTDISIPSYGQIFGHDKYYYEVFEPDDDEQFHLMSLRKNRIADYRNDYSLYWLKNKTRNSYSESYFGITSGRGASYCLSASVSLGVRPVFLMKG